MFCSGTTQAPAESAYRELDLMAKLGKAVETQGDKELKALLNISKPLLDKNSREASKALHAVRLRATRERDVELQ
jgi:hypothetical protein